MQPWRKFEKFMSKIRVLLVDDELGFTSGMKCVLIHRDFHVEVATNGLTALTLISGQRFDVVVLDIKMPGMDGIHVLSEIKRFVPDVPVIVLTGYYSSVEEEDTLKKGAYAYLLKPYPILELVDIILAAASGRDAISNS